MRIPSAELLPESAAAVLVALPADFLPQVDSIQANTTDDVMLTLRSGKKVLWGSGERSVDKAQVLQVYFSDGTEYEYYNVPQNVYNKFVNNDGNLRFARRHIFHSFTHRRVKKGSKEA